MLHLPKLFFLCLFFFLTTTGISFSGSTYPVTGWQNPDSRVISTLPLRTFQTVAGVYCREFQQNILIGNREEAAYGTACRQPDGHWQIVDPDTIQERAHSVSSVQMRQVTPAQVRAYSTVPGAVHSYSYHSINRGHHSVSLGFVEISRKGKYSRKHHLNKHRSAYDWRDRRDRYDWRGHREHYEWRDRHDRYEWRDRHDRYKWRDRRDRHKGKWRYDD